MANAGVVVGEGPAEDAAERAIDRAVTYAALTVMVLAPAAITLAPLALWMLAGPAASALSACAVAAYLCLSFSTRPDLKHGLRTSFGSWPLWRRLLRHYGGRVRRLGPQLDPGRRYLFALHPHGVLALDRILLWASRAEMWDKVFPGIDTRDLVASALLALPGLRELCLYSGCVNASRKVASRILAETKLSLLLYPGGEREQLETQHGRHRVYVSGRRGFLRLALQNGTPVVPCYIFGVVDEFATTSFAHGLRAWVQKRFAVALPLFWGTALLPWVPRQVPVTAVFGEAIEVGPPVAEPTDEQIAQLQKRYIEALTSVFDRCKAELATEDATLEVA
eukprot:m51a1_g4177 putative monoacylglycerol oacyltransferase (336) ;mRNA; r:347675-348749